MLFVRPTRGRGGHNGVKIDRIIIPLTSIENLKLGDLFRIIHTENSNQFDNVMIFYVAMYVTLYRAS